MSIRIEPSECGKLMLSGDVEALVDLPLRCRDGGFSMAFSDGTLVAATSDLASGKCTFEVVGEGAAIAKIEHISGVEALVLDWRIEWLVIAPRADTIVLADRIDDGEQPSLDLHDRMLCAA